MSKFYISIKSVLKDYAVEINVWDTSKLKGQMIAGIEMKPDIDSLEPEKRQEPVLPANSRSSILGNLLGPGTVEQIDLIWLSTGEYPINTIVQVNDQGNTKYRVVNKSIYRSYSDLTIYELKGDTAHGNGY